jgi:hypothetical protein
MLTPMRFAPCVPHWIMIQRETEMQIDDQCVHFTAFVGVTTTQGFYPEGTFFLFK